MIWIAALHIALVSTWVGSLVLVMALCADRIAGSRREEESLLTASLRLFAWIACLCGVGGVLSGALLAWLRDFDGGWLPLKMLFVALLTWTHLYVGRLVARLRDGDERHGGGYYWLISSAPPLVSLPILYFVLAKPL